jgi:hypothetical protein
MRAPAQKIILIPTAIDQAAASLPGGGNDRAQDRYKDSNQ